MADPGCYFGPVDNSIEVGCLPGVFRRNLSRIVLLEEIVEIFISGPENFSLVDLS